VKRHGGAITVQSEVGRGTTFRVYLPAVADRGAGQEETCAPLQRGSERILHVDDEEMLTVVVQKMLTQLGYQVTSSTSSLEALELFRQNPQQFDLVITDYTMPHLTGADLSRQLLTIRSDIPIILCTGFSERITEEGAREAGIREFAMKPLNMQSVATMIRRVLDNHGSNPSEDAATEGSLEAIVRMTKECCTLSAPTHD
jgi:CheY-like chemotaxis protein